ncbi:hypothetical protein MMPV_003722 [Pyropia vietnamensis]
MTDKEQLVTEGEARVVVKAADMAEVMQTEAINVAIEALSQHAVERDVARSVKVAFDAAYGPAWHCVVGRDYGSYVTHEVGAGSVREGNGASGKDTMVSEHTGDATAASGTARL